MSEKTKMYRCEVNKKFNNNQSFYSSYYHHDDNTFKLQDLNDIRKKINNLFESPNFIYRTKVNLVINNQILSKKVIGLYNNNLVTIDNEQIPINLIQDIYK